ncbi:Contactin-associated protein-like 4 Cell recognition molecule Caspr4 Precursor [Channa argus]|uniref:Contactin-associated protein-like 4 Cell recognition molecule Caspr4 n=1 Tax=Channa argus TaxID=215402 RepID=A0A6G1PKA5_CHAAH|nr:Contactin-associated protein-like 4 Cell recognition molecule Caspr4 Precursor [Channa argus]
MPLGSKRLAGIIALLGSLLLGSCGTGGEGVIHLKLSYKELLDFPFNGRDRCDLLDKQQMPKQAQDSHQSQPNCFTRESIQPRNGDYYECVKHSQVQILDENCAEVCDSPLVSGLPPSSFRSSSQLSSSHGPVFAKVNRREVIVYFAVSAAKKQVTYISNEHESILCLHGWMANAAAAAFALRDVYNYGVPLYIFKEETGFGDRSWRLVSSCLRQIPVVGGGSGKKDPNHSGGHPGPAFPGNSNADSVVQYKLEQPVIARYLRLIPLDWNPTGRIGLRLEIYGCRYTSDVANFDGGSSLIYRLSVRPIRTAIEIISLKFKTLKNSGTLLHTDRQRDHSLTLVLEKGRLLLYHQQGVSSSSGGQLLLSLGSLLDDQHWHHVKLERLSGHLNLTVDKHTQQVHIPAELSHSDIHQLSLGAVQSHGLQKPILSNRNFHGCLENLFYNELNLIDLAKQKNHQVTVMGNVTFSCVEPVSAAVTFTDSQSFLQLPGLTSWSSGIVSVVLQFRTWNKAGLLLTFDLPQQDDTVWLYLSEARLRLQMNKEGRTTLELSAGTLIKCVPLGSGLNDGQWHSVELHARQDRLSITVDKDEGATAHTGILLPLTADSQLFFGGCPVQEGSQVCRNPFKVFQGCMRLLTLDDQPVDLIKVQQRLLGNYNHLQIDMCGIVDRALFVIIQTRFTTKFLQTIRTRVSSEPLRLSTTMGQPDLVPNTRCSPSHCEHGGRCTQSWRTFHCNCSNSGYRGATCHSSTYEQSCEAYKHKGNTSGHYFIDVDGSGPIKPQLVYCNMTGDKAWMVIQHNNTELTTVELSPEKNQHAAHFDYASEDEQLAAVISQSEHCEQELSYHCRKSRLLNTPEGAPFSWWVGGPGPGQVQTYWGGALPGSRQCACGLQDTCLDSHYYCNCDADYDQWTNDSGLLTHKENLPVRSLVLGDIHRLGSEAAYRVGPLHCHGDKNFWNAAFFDKETSYLHFPTFHGELNADISFLFKTTSSSGVFLENLGIKDFIRIELRSSFEVVFSFDVGNGPLEVQAKTSVPLNDNRWHVVRAERNVKEASLRVDELPAATQEAPADGHIHLQLNSQLFIGFTTAEHVSHVDLACVFKPDALPAATLPFVLSGLGTGTKVVLGGWVGPHLLNGITLDLEERAKITPGVRPGCPGHCSSYGSLCQNQGRCVEKANGFSCDCGQSAYTGAFCHEGHLMYRLYKTSIMNYCILSWFLNEEKRAKIRPKRIRHYTDPDSLSASLPARFVLTTLVVKVAASFKSTTSIAYMLKESYELNRNNSAWPSSIYSDMTLRGENISMSFRTSQSPALLLYINSFFRENLAVLINDHDELELRYKLHSSRDVEVLKCKVTDLADGHLHTVTIRRLADAVSVQIDQNAREDFNLTSEVDFHSIKSLILGRVQEPDELDAELAGLASLGFTGCLSAVRFNSITPLKAALLRPDSPVIVTGPLTQSSCGSSSPANPYAAETTHPLSEQPSSVDPGQPLVNAIRSDSALIGGVIAVVVFLTVSALGIMARFICSRKETYRNREVKAAQPEEGHEFPFSSEMFAARGRLTTFSILNRVLIDPTVRRPTHPWTRNWLKMVKALLHKVTVRFVWELSLKFPVARSLFLEHRKPLSTNTEKSTTLTDANFKTAIPCRKKGALEIVFD